MFFTKTGGLKKKSEFGRVYVLQLTLKCGKVINKVGMCNSDRSNDRMFEILRSFFNTYRYVPQCKLRRDKKVRIPLLVEKHLHNILDEWSYTFDKKFDGSTEFFEDLDESVLLDYLDEFTYRNLLVGQVQMKEVDYDAIKQAIELEKPLPTPTDLKADEIPF